jgi:hypothetical protein
MRAEPRYPIAQTSDSCTFIVARTMGFFEFFEPAEPIASTRYRRMARLPAPREADQFLEDLTGDAPWKAARAVASPAAVAVGTSRGHTWARQVFDEIARQGPPLSLVVSGPFDGSRWTIVALPGSSTPAGNVRSGDLVVRRALGEEPLVSLRLPRRRSGSGSCSG